jgi:hypothetical protein
LSKGKPVEIRPSSGPKGALVSKEDIERWNKAANQINQLDNLVKKLDKKIEEIDGMKVEIKELNSQMI